MKSGKMEYLEKELAGISGKRQITDAQDLIIELISLSLCNRVFCGIRTNIIILFAVTNVLFRKHTPYIIEFWFTFVYLLLFNTFNDHVCCYIFLNCTN